MVGQGCEGNCLVHQGSCTDQCTDDACKQQCVADYDACIDVCDGVGHHPNRDASTDANATDASATDASATDASATDTASDVPAAPSDCPDLPPEAGAACAATHSCFYNACDGGIPGYFDPCCQYPGAPNVAWGETATCVAGKWSVKGPPIVSCP